jgi:hypothetical protein
MEMDEFPASPGPELRIEHYSSPCSFGLTPILMTGFLIQWIGDHFSRRQNIEHPELRDVLWRANTRNGILIASITDWKPAAVENRPAVIVKRNAWQPERLAIDDRLTPSGDGYEHYCMLMRGSHTIFCLAGEGGEVEVLGAEVFRELLTFCSIIRRTLDLKRFSVSELGPVHELQEATENYAVPITVAYASELDWRIEQDAPMLKRFVLSANLLAPTDNGGQLCGVCPPGTG